MRLLGLPNVSVRCDACEGRRFSGEVLESRWRGHNAYELLELTVDLAAPLLSGHPKLARPLRALREVGLGYLPLGQPAHTLSGGETKRLKLARELARGRTSAREETLYVFDEPSLGLHPQDVQLLVGVLVRLAEEGATVWVASHDAALVAASGAWIDAAGGASA